MPLAWARRSQGRTPIGQTGVVQAVTGQDDVGVGRRLIEDVTFDDGHPAVVGARIDRDRRRREGIDVGRRDGRRPGRHRGDRAQSGARGEVEDAPAAHGLGVVSEIATDGESASPGERPVRQRRVGIVGHQLDGVPQRQRLVREMEADLLEARNRAQVRVAEDEGAVRDLQPTGPERMTHASSAAWLLPTAGSRTFTQSRIVPATTTALPAARRPVSRSGGQSKTLPHSSEAHTSISVGHASAGSAAAASAASAMAEHDPAATAWHTTRGGGPVGATTGAGEGDGSVGRAVGDGAGVVAATAAMGVGRAAPAASAPTMMAMVTTIAPVAARIRRLRRRLSGVGSTRNSIDLAYSAMGDGGIGTGSAVRGSDV